MFNLSENAQMRGIGYKALNILRPCNVISLLMLSVASWVMIVMTGVNGQFFFFDAITHVFVSSISIFLILTEVQFGPLKRYFERSWPVFSDRHGLFWLGSAMVVLGCDMLACLNKPAFSIASIGLPLWRVILAAGILAITFGVFNFVATLVFRDGPSGLTARMIRSDGNLADASKYGDTDMANPAAYYASATLSSQHTNTIRYNKAKEDMIYNTSGSDVESAYAPAPEPTVPEPVATSGGMGGRFRRLTQHFKRGPHGGDDADDSIGLATSGKKMHISRPIPVGNYDDEQAGYASDGYFGHAGTIDAATAVGSDTDGDFDHVRAHHEALTQAHGGDVVNGKFDFLKHPPPDTSSHPAFQTNRPGTATYSVAGMSQF